MTADICVEHVVSLTIYYKMNTISCKKSQYLLMEKLGGWFYFCKNLFFSQNFFSGFIDYFIRPDAHTLSQLYSSYKHFEKLSQIRLEIEQNRHKFGITWFTWVRITNI